jgi:hypothetical protein
VRARSQALILMGDWCGSVQSADTTRGDNGDATQLLTPWEGAQDTHTPPPQRVACEERSIPI